MRHQDALNQLNGSTGLGTIRLRILSCRLSCFLRSRSLDLCQGSAFAGPLGRRLLLAKSGAGRTDRITL
jgi:hypothetical protein